MSISSLSLGLLLSSAFPFHFQRGTEAQTFPGPTGILKLIAGFVALRSFIILLSRTMICFLADFQLYARTGFLAAYKTESPEFRNVPAYPVFKFEMHYNEIAPISDFIKR